MYAWPRTGPGVSAVLASIHLRFGSRPGSTNSCSRPLALSDSCQRCDVQSGQRLLRLLIGLWGFEAGFEAVADGLVAFRPWTPSSCSVPSAKAPSGS